MELDHETVVAFAKSWDLFYLIAMAIGVFAYLLWPGSGKRFEHAANSIMDDENGPCV